MQGFIAAFRATFFSVLLFNIAGCANFLPTTQFIEPQNQLSKGELHGRYLVTSTVFVSDGINSIMIDGFLTRQSIFQSIVNGMKSDQEMIKASLTKAEIDKVDILLVGHSHYDHALDSEAVAIATNAILIGSEKTISLSPGAQSKPINTNETITIGDFQISFYQTPHVGKGAFFRGLEKFVLWSTRGSRFKDHSEVYSFFLQHPQGNILIIPSAGFADNVTLPDQADIVFLSIGLLANQTEHYIKNYWQTAVVDTCASWVIPIHWDNFSKPLTTPIESAPSLIDDVSKTMQLLNELALHSDCTNSPVKILFPPAFDAFLLNQASNPE